MQILRILFFTAKKIDSNNIYEHVHKKQSLMAKKWCREANEISTEE